MTRLLEVGAVDIEAIREDFPLADFVADTVILKRRGNALKGLCPFHDERTPSFQVYEKDQRYHCFGCGAHGDLFDFAEHIKGWSIRETAEHLGRGIIPIYTPDRIEEIRAKRLAMEEAEEAERAKVILQSRERWESAVPVIGHGYLTIKGIDAHGTRIDADGKLLTPIMGQDGKIQCVQAIDPDGRKEFPYKGTVSGGFFILGGKVSKATDAVLICEGFATAASLQEATGRTVICSYNGGNMLKVASFFSGKYPGVKYLIAGDNDHNGKDNSGLKHAQEAAAILDCEYILPVHGDESTATDFNDMAKEYGLEAVRDLVVNRTKPDGHKVKGPIEDVDAFDFEEALIPVRPWIIKGVMLAKHTHMLVAPGGSGKSLFTLQLGITLATGAQWGEWTPKRRCKTAIINVEDDIDEQRRRLAAARTVMKPDPALLKGMMKLVTNSDSIVVAKVDSQSKSVISTPIVSQLRAYILENEIDVLIVDPFAETFEGDENSNSEVKWAMKVWRDEIARPTGCAVYLVHHTVKYAAGGAGNADVIRGAGAIVNSTRISSTLFPMTQEEAGALGIEPDMRNRYVRFDDAKANQSLVSATGRWFEKVSVVLENGTGLDEPDEVGALRPWAPPSAFAGLSVKEMHNALALIGRGIEGDRGSTGELFTAHFRARSDRWVGKPIMAAMGVEESRAKLIVKDWMRTGLLFETEYRDRAEGKERKGVAVDPNKLPTDVERGEF